MIEKLLNLDTDVFYLINQCHDKSVSHFLMALSANWSWAMLLVGIFVVVTLRLDRKNWLVILVGIGLCFLLADRIAELAFKDVFMRVRPCNALSNVHLLGHHPHSFSFVSGHAANSFALATFLAHRYIKIPHFAVGMFVWAALVGYSRVYMGVHYPGDVIGGALLGVGCGWLVYKLFDSPKVQTLFQHPYYFWSKSKSL